MDHQDWNPIIFHKRVDKGASSSTREGNLQNKIEKSTGAEEDTVKLPSVSLNVRQKLSAARCAKNLSQQQLAEKMNVPKSVINDYESGKVVPNNNFLARVGTFLGVKLVNQ